MKIKRNRISGFFGMVSMLVVGFVLCSFVEVDNKRADVLDKRTIAIIKFSESIEAKIPKINVEKVNKKNILKTYQKFVKTTKKHYNDYTKEEAKMVLDLWDKLNNRKEEIEPLTAKLNKAIVTLKLEFVAVKVGLKFRLNQ